MPPTGPISSPLPEGTIAISVALREELRAILPLLSNRSSVQAEGQRWISGTIGRHAVALYRTGIGAANARQASLSFLQAARPQALIAAGFAGGAAAELKTGDLILADPLFDPPRPEGEGPRRIAPDPVLLAAAQKVILPGGRIHFGLVAGVRKVLVTPEEKREVWARHGALAFDMESLGVAKAANVHDTPLLSVRAVLDDSSLALPVDFGRLITPRGRPRLAAALWAFLKRPRALLGMADLLQRAQVARRRLAAFLDAFFKVW